jgi:hypothetical protein
MGVSDADIIDWLIASRPLISIPSGQLLTRCNTLSGTNELRRNAA